MILQALYDYYQRKAADPDSGIAPEGFERKEIKFVIVIDENGYFMNLEDLRENKNGKSYLLPKSVGRSGSNSWKTACLLWDHHGYILAHPKKGEPKDEQKNLEMAQKQNGAFVSQIEHLPPETKADAGVKAVLLFYKHGQDKEVIKHCNWNDCAAIAGCNLTFRLSGDTLLVPERPVVKAFVVTNLNVSDSDKESQYFARCLISGESGNIMSTHTRTPLPGESNAKLVGFQKNSGYDSYGKEQAYNAPVSVAAEFAYTTALNLLLGKDSENKFGIGDATVVFWSQKKDEVYNLEDDFSCFFADAPKDDPNKNILAVRNLYQAAYSGKLDESGNDLFYVLGLAPNAARISIRFWKSGTISDFAKKIKRHFDDMKIIRGPKDHEFLSLSQILRATVLEYKMDNVPPNLAAAVMNSVLDGTPYPRTLMHQCIRRIRAEQHVTRTRAAILKAYLNRLNTNQKEVNVSLDKSNQCPGYRLGRLFAALEKIQEEASPGLNATIRERYYGAASTSPVTVFSQLLKLKNHHLAKLANPGRKVNLERILGEIFDGINEFPAHLTMEEQARFAIGYYHQRQAFFESNKNESDSSK